MAKMSYTMLASLDGYVADERGEFRWAEPDEEVHRFVNDLEREIGTYLYGRRMYETMVAWEDPTIVAGQPAFIRDFAEVWRAADRVVYSSALETVRTARTRLERDFDPAAVRRLKATSERDLSIGGPELAGQALRAGLVDELRLLAVPIVVGGGTPWLPSGVRVRLELLQERRFAAGTLYLPIQSTQ